MKDNRVIWMNGEIIPWNEANVHVMTHAIHYGSSVFEGIRAYDTHKGTAIFRLPEHTRRLFESARVYDIDIGVSESEMSSICKQVVVANNLKEAYVRPVAFRGNGGLGLYAKPGSPIDTVVAAVEWGNFMGAEAREKGIRACVSSWARLAPNTMPSAVKAGGNYLSSQLITREAHRLGFDEGIGLSHDGTLSEGAGENLFIIRDDIIYTPTAGSSILCGITRDSVIKLAGNLGFEVREQGLPREALYTADEIFMTGTAAEITPVRSVDDNEVRCGGRGPMTKALQDAFFGLIDGTTEDEWGWWHPVNEQTASTDNVTRLVVK